MNKKVTIILFYAGVAVISVALIAVFQFWGKLRDQKSQENAKKFRAEQEEQMRVDNLAKYKTAWANYGLKEDLIGTNEKGEVVNLKESYKGKVVVFAQFYAACPHCEGVNFKVLQEVMQKYGDKGVKIVTVNVNDKELPLVKLRHYAKTWGQDKGIWSFVKTDTVKFNKWAQKNLAYAEFKKNEGPLAESQPVDHDMGIVVINRNGVMINKEDVYSANISREGNSEEATVKFGDRIKQELFDSVQYALDQKEGK